MIFKTNIGVLTQNGDKTHCDGLIEGKMKREDNGMFPESFSSTNA